MSMRVRIFSFAVAFLAVGTVFGASSELAGNPISAGLHKGRPEIPIASQAPRELDLTQALGAASFAKLAAAAGYSDINGEWTGPGSGYTFAGTTSSYGAQGKDVWIFSVDSLGVPTTSKVYGGPNNEFGVPRKTADGGFIVAGSTSSVGPSTSWIMKIDSTGAITWQKSVPSDLPIFPLALEVSGGFLFTGNKFDLQTFSLTTILFKLDSDGALLWKKSYSLGLGGPSLTAFLVQELSDHTLVMTGMVIDPKTQDTDMFLMRMSADGTPTWAKSYGGTGRDEVVQVLETGGGGLLLQGSTQSFGAGGTTEGPGDAWLLKLDGTGDVEWQKAYGGVGDEAMVAQIDPAGGYVLGGTTTSFGAGQEDIWGVKLNAAGDVVWQKAYGGSGSDIGYVAADPDGGYFLGGYTNSFGAGGKDVWLAKLNSSGSVVWQNTYGTTKDDIGTGFRLPSDLILIVADQSDPQVPEGTEDDVWYLLAGSTGEVGQSCAFIAPGTGVTATTTATTTTTTATPVTLSVTVADPTLVLGTGTLGSANAPFEVTDICSAAGCTGSAECDDSNPCTNDACQSGNCTHTNNTAACSDGSVCTNGDHCSQGSCVSGTAVNCDDANSCTNDSCNAETGCAHANNTAACDDGNGCTTGEACLNGACTGGTAVSCNDANQCTTDACVPANGTCSHTPISCDDSNGCTLDSCDSATGCLHVDQGCGPLEVVFPDGGERLPTGVVATIRWNAPQNMATFDIHYSIDNGGTWKKIASAQTGRAYDWSVPALPGNKPKCKVRVTGRTASGAKAGADLSDAAFLIEVLVLHAPNGGESLGSGSLTAITWSTHATAKPVAKVKLLYTLNGGNTWKAITTLSSNPGSFDWTLPTVTTTKANCKVRVQLKDSAGNPLGKDDSDAVFTITP